MITRMVNSLCPIVNSLLVNKTVIQIAMTAQKIAILAYLDWSEPKKIFWMFILLIFTENKFFLT